MTPQPHLKLLLSDLRDIEASQCIAPNLLYNVNADSGSEDDLMNYNI